MNAVLLTVGASLVIVAMLTRFVLVPLLLNDRYYVIDPSRLIGGLGAVLIITAAALWAVQSVLRSR